MKWQLTVCDNPEEVIEFLNSLGNGPDYEAKIVYLNLRFYIFYPIKK